MSVAVQAAAHLGKNYTENLRSTKNQPLKSFRQFISSDWQQPMWREATLLTDRAVQFATAKTYVISDSVLCLGSRFV